MEFLYAFLLSPFLNRLNVEFLTFFIVSAIEVGSRASTLTRDIEHVNMEIRFQEFHYSKKQETATSKAV